MNEVRFKILRKCKESLEGIIEQLKKAAEGETQEGTFESKQRAESLEELAQGFEAGVEILQVEVLES